MPEWSGVNTHNDMSKINKHDLAQHHADLLAQEGYDPAKDQALSGLADQIARAAGPTGTLRFSKGDCVTFTGRGGKRVTGTVTRVNQKTIGVESGDMSWRVSPRLLSAGSTDDLPAAPERHRFAVGDAATFEMGSKAVRCVVERVNAKTCTVVCEDGRGFRVAHRGLTPTTIEAAELPQGLSALVLGRKRSEGVGMEGPRWTQPWRLDTARGEIKDHGDGGPLWVTGVGESKLHGACDQAITEACPDFDAYGEGVAFVVEWMENGRLFGQTLGEYLRAS